jgi:galactokinase
MTAAHVADALVERGLPEAERPAILSVCERVLSAFDPGGEPPRVWWTPGRLEVFGGHTDYAGGCSLVCAVPRGIVLAARRTLDGGALVTDTASSESVMFETPVDVSSFIGWRRYVAVTLARLSRNFPVARCGCKIAFESTLPSASGMSSSSALMIAVASAVVSLNELRRQEAWMANIASPLDMAGYYACIENGRSFRTLDGDSGVGTHGGSEDHAAILTGRASTVTAFRFAPMSRIADVVVPRRWRFVIAPSHVRAEKTGGAQAGYNRLAADVQALLDLWNVHEQPASSLAAALGSESGAIETLRTHVRASDLPEAEVERYLRRLEHFVREDAIVRASLPAFRGANTAQLGALSAESQDLAESLLRNQVPATARLADDARRLGAFAARSFGAGFGGSVWALLDAGAAANFAEAWHPEAFVMRPGPPHTRL